MNNEYIVIRAESEKASFYNFENDKIIYKKDGKV
jgi:hypothetical protein